MDDETTWSISSQQCTGRWTVSPARAVRRSACDDPDSEGADGSWKEHGRLPSSISNNTGQPGRPGSTSVSDTGDSVSRAEHDATNRLVQRWRRECEQKAAEVARLTSLCRDQRDDIDTLNSRICNTLSLWRSDEQKKLTQIWGLLPPEAQAEGVKQKWDESLKARFRKMENDLLSGLLSD